MQLLFRLSTALLMTFALTSVVNASDDAQIESLKATITSRFANADSNHDGHLPRDEAKTKMPRVYAHFDAIDVNHQGSITLDQIMAYGSAQYAARQK